MINLISPENGHEHSLLTKYHREFYDHENAGRHANYADENNPYPWIWKYGNGLPPEKALKAETFCITGPETAVFMWSADKPTHLEIERTDGETYPNDPTVGEIREFGRCDCCGIWTATVGNLFAGTEYSWKIVADDGSEESEKRTLRTKREVPRAVYAHGTVNIRDLGGLETYDGKRVRQGRIYRGVALDTRCWCDDYKLTERGKAVMRDQLKIKTELDLRGEAVALGLRDSILGDGVNYVALEMEYYCAYRQPKCYENIRRIFELFADEANYPIYFHCQAGADRTGTVAYMLEALLGVVRRQLVSDFNITSLSLYEQRNWTRNKQMESMYNDWAEAGGDVEPIDARVSRGVESELINLFGVKKETLDRIKELLLQER